MWAHPQVESGNSAGCRAAHSCDYIEKDEALYLFGGWSGKTALNDVWRFDLTTLEWRLVHGDGKQPRPRNNHASAVVDRKIYIHGGHDGSTWLSDFYVFDTETSTWAEVVRPWHLRPCGSCICLQTTSGVGPSARACHTMSKVGGKLFVFGGFDGAHCFNDVDILDLGKHNYARPPMRYSIPTTNVPVFMHGLIIDTFTWIHPIVHGYHPAPRNAHTMSIVGSSLFMFGGHSGAKHLRDLYQFHTDTLTWTHLASVDGMFPPGLRGHTANVKLPKVYFFGGYDGRGRSNELYILNTRTSVHALMYIVGGFDGFKWLDDTHVLDICRIEEHAITMTTQRQLVSQYRELLLHQDATLTGGRQVQDKPIVAHKAIVAAQSEHFRRMFSSGMKESHQPTVVISEWTHRAFFHMLVLLGLQMYIRNDNHEYGSPDIALMTWMDGRQEFLYTGYIQDLTVDTALELLGVADHYALQVHTIATPLKPL
ncbi:hypothetical protein DYB30_003819 [Aphanomyces astaci]|uniref:BTB domain-containing protein n=1 Tax=Aphanomyces astaci TaxID=112090 RepID=A0A397DRQ8_APHAT|nr:hypothetical protein DYB30_003819 [Aphanomyces astaci]